MYKYYFKNFRSSISRFNSLPKSLNFFRANSSIAFYNYAHKIKKPVLVSFSYPQLLSGNVINLVQDKIQQGYCYIVIIRVKYGSDMYYMAGKNFAFKFDDEDNSNNLIAFYENIYTNIQTFFNKTESGQELCKEDIEGFDLICRRIDSKFLTDLKIDPTSLALSDEMKQKDIFNKQINYFPIVTSNDILGNPLRDITVNQQGVVTNIRVKLDDKSFDLMEKISFQNKIKSINKKDPVILDKDYRFYLRNNVTTPHVLAIKQIDTDTYKKDAFTFNGIRLETVVDKIESDKLVYRKINDKKSLEIKNNEITYSEENMILTPIKASSIIKRGKDINFTENPNIGVIDLETYKNSTIERARVYSAGLYSVHDQKPIMFYIDKQTMDNGKVIYDLLDEMFKYKYRGIKWYCHNFGRFDSVFIISALEAYNKKQINTNDKNKYEMKFRDRNGSIIKLLVKNITDKYVKLIEIRDSYAILPDKLKILSAKYEVEKGKQKGDFPHAFSSEKTIFYKGNIPDIKYYDYDLEPSTYKAMYKSDWSFKEESLFYLEKDLYSLYEVIRKANKRFFRLFKVHMTDSLTISSLSMQIYMKYYYPEEVIPLIKNSKLYIDIKQAYYGGLTEVYKPYGENLHHYDVNSLYPFVALQDMPGIQCIKKFFINKSVDIDNLFGFFYCEIETNNNYLGLLPVRDESGLIFPNGKWRGWYFSEELKYAKANGYKIKVIKGYEFNKEKDVFKSFIDTIYKLKCNADNSADYLIFKMILNSLLGRFALKIEKSVTKLVDLDTFNKIVTTRLLTSLPKRIHDSMLVSYNPESNKKLCDSIGIDVAKVRNYELETTNEDISEIENSYPGVSVAMSAAVTAYGRIHMCKIKKDILSLGGKLYYSDTDSIVTDLELEQFTPEKVHPKEIGKLKKENFVVRGYFISGKTYCLVLNDDKLIKKTKGFKNHNLTENHYIKMWQGEIIDTAIKMTGIKDYEDGSVTLIVNEKAKLNKDGYTRREKLYENNMWVDTKPLVISHDFVKHEKNVLEDKSLDNLNKETGILKKKRFIELWKKKLNKLFTSFTCICVFNFKSKYWYELGASILLLFCLILYILS